MSFSLLIIISIIAKTAFYIELVSLVDILLYNLCQLTIEHKSMPIGAVGNLCTILQCIATLCCC